MACRRDEYIPGTVFFDILVPFRRKNAINKALFLYYLKQNRAAERYGKGTVVFLELEISGPVVGNRHTEFDRDRDALRDRTAVLQARHQQAHGLFGGDDDAVTEIESHIAEIECFTIISAGGENHPAAREIFGDLETAVGGV